MCRFNCAGKKEYKVAEDGLLLLVLLEFWAFPSSLGHKVERGKKLGVLYCLTYFSWRIAG